MKYKKPILTALVLVSCLVLFCSMPVFAAELTEAQVEEAVAEQGKEAVTGNVFIWFLCAIAFLKVSQKIDSFMASLGINVGNTGGNMMFVDEAHFFKNCFVFRSEEEPSMGMVVAADTAGHPLPEAQPLAAAFSPEALPVQWDARYSGKPSMLLPTIRRAPASEICSISPRSRKAETLPIM